MGHNFSVDACCGATFNVDTSDSLDIHVNSLTEGSLPSDLTLYMFNEEQGSLATRLAVPGGQSSAFFQLRHKSLNLTTGASYHFSLRRNDRPNYEICRSATFKVVQVTRVYTVEASCGEKFTKDAGTPLYAAVSINYSVLTNGLCVYLLNSQDQWIDKKTVPAGTQSASIQFHHTKLAIGEKYHFGLNEGDCEITTCDEFQVVDMEYVIRKHTSALQPRTVCLARER
jgi:hypothetical protein